MVPLAGNFVRILTMIPENFQRNLPFKMFRILFIYLCKYGFDFHSCSVLSHYHFLSQAKSTSASVVVFPTDITSNVIYSKYPFKHIQTTFSLPVCV